MPEINYTSSFLKRAKVLPKAIQKKLAENLELLQKNPFYPTLHAKPLSGSLIGFYSFRITRDWRVIFCFVDAKTIKLIDATHRKDVYR